MERSTNRVLPPLEIHEVRQSVPFRIFVTNFSNGLWVYSRTYWLQSAWSYQRHQYHSRSWALIKSRIKRSPLPKIRGLMEGGEPHQQVVPENEQSKTHIWRQEILINDKCNEYRDKLQKTMEEFETMWNGYLRWIRIASQTSTELKPGQE